MRHAEAETISPFRQGRLDRLCGVYGIINSIRWGLKNNSPLTGHQSQLLYIRLVQYLESRELLAPAMEVGLCIPEISQLINVAKGWLGEKNILLKHRKPFHKQKSVSTTAFVDCIAEAIKSPNTSVLMATIGRLDHWTTVKSVNKHHLQLFDSNGHRSIGIDAGDTQPLTKSGKSIQFLSTGLFVLNFSLGTKRPDDEKHS